MERAVVDTSTPHSEQVQITSHTFSTISLFIFILRLGADVYLSLYIGKQKIRPRPPLNWSTWHHLQGGGRIFSRTYVRIPPRPSFFSSKLDQRCTRKLGCFTLGSVGPVHKINVEVVLVHLEKQVADLPASPEIESDPYLAVFLAVLFEHHETVAFAVKGGRSSKQFRAVASILFVRLGAVVIDYSGELQFHHEGG